MTDKPMIPSEIIERAARAVYKQNIIDEGFGIGPSAKALLDLGRWKSCVPKAEAALTAAGYGELREALDEFATWARQVGEQPPSRVNANIAKAGRDLIARYSAALAIGRGEKR